MRDVPLTLDDVDWPVRTDRLLIRRRRTDDVEPLFALRTHPAVSTWAMSVPTDLAQWREAFTNPAIAPHMLTVEQDGEVVGEAMVHVRDGEAQKEVAGAAAGTEAELGWLVAADRQGQGLATEVGRALIRLCCDDLGLRRVVASTIEPNVASWRVAEKLGMRLETRSLRHTLHRDLGWVDARVYALLADERPGG